MGCHRANGNDNLTCAHLSIIFVSDIIGLFEALRHGQQFFSHVRTACWAYLILSHGDEVSCSRTQHRAPGAIRTRDHAIKSCRKNLLCVHCILNNSFFFMFPFLQSVSNQTLGVILPSRLLRFKKHNCRSHSEYDIKSI